MIPVKLVETIFHRYWALLLPVIVVPLIVLGLTSKPRQYQSTAVVWVSNPVASERPVLGANNPYLTPAQNQAQAINDLLSTRAYRVQVAMDAGIVHQGADDKALRRGAALVRSYAYASGVNLVTISAISTSDEVAQAIVTGVINQYRARATATLASDAEVSAQYYNQQLALAQQGLAQKTAELAEYLKANPKAADPSNVASQELAYRTLKDAADSQASLVASLQQALQSIALRSASAPETQASMFVVQDAPTRPEAPLPQSLTSRLGMPIAGMFLGLCIGSAYLYVVYRTDHTIRSAEDLSELNVPLLGSVPQLQPAPQWARYTPVAWYLRWRRRDFARKTAASISNGRPMNSSASTEVA